MVRARLHAADAVVLRRWGERIVTASNLDQVFSAD
jgi:hypothetical protein